MTPNQLVATRLREARLACKWTQEDAAQKLERNLGTRWSVATWSAAERSANGPRAREFTADEIVAIARTFDLPPCFFFEDHEGHDPLAELVFQLRALIDCAKTLILAAELRFAPPLGPRVRINEATS